MSIKNVVKIALFIINVGLCAQQYPDLYRVAEITIPKCGTMLLAKMLLMMSHAKVAIPRRRFFLIDANAIKMLMMDPRWLLVGHAIYVNDNIKKMSNERIKKVFIFRDPRDQVVSAAFWLKTIERIEEKTWDLDVLD